MFCLLFLSSLLFSTFGTVCVWNRYGEQLNIYLNGNYELSQIIFNNNPVYIRNNTQSDGTCGASVTYMFYSNDKWRIKKELSDSASNSAKCDYDQEETSSPWDCTEWYFPSSVDDRVTVTNSECPVEICDSIDFRLDGSSCDNKVFTKISDNMYFNSESDRYLYFNREGFRWVCDNSDIDYDGCISASGFTEKTTPNQNPWIGFDSSNLEATQVWNNGNTATFVCNLDGNAENTETTTTQTPQTTTTQPQTTTSQPQTTTNSPETTTNPILNVESLCFWNNWNSSNKFLNGQYFYDGTLNSHTVYVSHSETCGNVYTSYLVYSDYNKWFIVDSRVSSGSWRAICEENNTDNPTDCTAWEIPSVIDRNPTLTLGNCPTVPCDTIEFTLDDPTETCSGLTFSKYGDSGLAYYNSDENKYLYFNTDYFRWVCDSDLDTTCLSAHSWSDYSNSNPWINFNSITAVSKPWKDGLTATFKCNSEENSSNRICCIHKNSFPESELDCRERTVSLECRSNNNCKWCTSDNGCDRAETEC